MTKAYICLIALFHCFFMPLYGDEKCILNLTIENAINLAWERNQNVLDAYAKLESAELGVELHEKEFGLKVFRRGDIGYVGGGKTGSGATIGGGIDLVKKFPFGTEITISPSLMKAAHKYDSLFRACISQPLFRAFNYDYFLSPLHSSQFSVRTATRSLLLTQINIMIQIIQSLYEVVKQEKMLVLDTESYERLKKFTDATRVKESIGLSDALDVYRAEIELRHAQDQKEQSRERLQDAKDRVRELLFLDCDQEFEANVSLEYSPVDISIDEAIKTALNKRLELEQAHDYVCESKRMAKIAKINLTPDFNFLVDYSSSARDEILTRTYSGKRESKWGIGLTTSTANFDNFHEKNAYEQSQMNVDNAKRNFFMVKNNLILEIKRMMRALDRTLDRIASQEKQIKNFQGEYHLAKAKFEHRMANNFDVIQAEKSTRMAQNGLISSIIEHIIEEYRLLAAMGVLIDREETCR
ncbi:TolC family protein [Parachlamydia acanthamoebae]|nr:TolC family protein [Parachlamydia acanthamoebae]